MLRANEHHINAKALQISTFVTCRYLTYAYNAIAQSVRRASSQSSSGWWVCHVNSAFFHNEMINIWLKCYPVFQWYSFMQITSQAQHINNAQYAWISERSASQTRSRLEFVFTVSIHSPKVRLGVFASSCSVWTELNWTWTYNIIFRRHTAHTYT